MSTTVSVYSIAPFKKPRFEWKSYSVTGEPISNRVTSEQEPFVMTVDTRISDGGYTAEDE